MSQIFGTIKENRLTIKYSFITSGQVEVVKCEFSFDEGWDGFNKTAVFYQTEDNVKGKVLGITGTQCIVPWETLVADKVLYIGVFGTKGAETKTTSIEKIWLELGSKTEYTTPNEPTPDVYAQILDLIEEYRQDNEEYAEEAEERLEEVVEARTSTIKGISFNRLKDRLESSETDIEDIENKVNGMSGYGVLIGSGTGAITALGVAANGQLLIGSGRADPVLANLTPGTGINISNAAGAITIGLDEVTNDRQVKAIDSSTKGMIPLWDSNTGDLLKDGYYPTDGVTGGATLWNNSQLLRAGDAQEYIDSIIAANNAMVYKGTLGTSQDGGTQTTLPTAYNVGWTYVVVTAGEYANKACEIGDMVIAIVTRTSGGQDTDWTVVQANINGAVVGPTSSISGNFPVFSGTTGKVIANSNFGPSSFARFDGIDSTYINNYTTRLIVEQDGSDGAYITAYQDDAASEIGLKSSNLKLVNTYGVPIRLTSTTLNPNLNADLLDGKHAIAFLDSATPTVKGSWIYLNSDVTGTPDSGLETTWSGFGTEKAKLYFKDSDAQWHSSRYAAGTGIITTVPIANKKVFTIGDNSNTLFTLSHYWKTQDLTVSIRERASPFSQVYADVSFPTEDTIKIGFAVAPTINQYAVTVIG